MALEEWILRLRFACGVDSVEWQGDFDELLAGHVWLLSELGSNMSGWLPCGARSGKAAVRTVSMSRSRSASDWRFTSRASFRKVTVESPAVRERVQAPSKRNTRPCNESLCLQCR